MLLRGSENGWTFVDRVLAVASVLSDDLRCPGCGHPKHEAWNPDSEGYYEAQEAICQGCSAVIKSGEGQKDHGPELKRWTIDTRPKDVALRPWNPLD